MTDGSIGNSIFHFNVNIKTILIKLHLKGAMSMKYFL